MRARSRARRVIGGAALAFAAAFSYACGGGGGGGAADDCSDEPGVSCQWAGVPPEQGYDGEGIDRLESRLNWPTDITFGPDGLAYLTDWNNHLIRRVEEDGTVNTAMGTQVEGDGPPGETDRLPLGTLMALAAWPIWLIVVVL